MVLRLLSKQGVMCILDGEKDNIDNYYLGVELGSTRVKSVVIDDSYNVVASGTSNWENKYQDGYWTYSLEDIWDSLETSIQDLKNDLSNQDRDISITAAGISAMMHGYLAFDKDDNLLVPFRTWRNSTTEASAKVLSELFQFNIPQRWGIAHLYQAILNQEEHVPEIAYVTTLAGYVHWQLTGEKVLGIGDASGLFPIDSSTRQYDQVMLEKFNQLIADHNFPWQLEDILPKVKTAGQEAGTLTEQDLAKLNLTSLCNEATRFAPPEGDAGTGMVATNSIEQRTSNISIGTSAFMMVVLENKLKGQYEEVDIVTTPEGEDVAMIHTNNCSSEINAWMNLFQEFIDLFNFDIETDELYERLFNQTYETDADNELFIHALHSGENVFNLNQAYPALFRNTNSRLSLPNIMRANLYAAFAPLKYGIDILNQHETINIDRTIAHGGLFKTPKVAQRVLASALNQTISLAENASEGGSWGIAILAAYMNQAEQYTLTEFLNELVFAERKETAIEPDNRDVQDYNAYYEKYIAALPIQVQINSVLSEQHH